MWGCVRLGPPTRMPLTSSDCPSSVIRAAYTLTSSSFQTMAVFVPLVAASGVICVVAARAMTNGADAASDVASITEPVKTALPHPANATDPLHARVVVYQRLNVVVE